MKEKNNVLTYFSFLSPPTSNNNFNIRIEERALLSYLTQHENTIQ